MTQVELSPLVFIVQDEQVFQTYAWLCAQANIPYLRAEGGLHVLTQLERSKPSAIICETRLSDMQGLELWSIVRSDPVTADIPFFLFSNRQPEEFVENVDYCLSQDLCTPLALASIVQQALPTVPMPPVLSLDGLSDLTCTARTFTFTELIVWLNENQKTGHWIIKSAHTSGYLLMNKGEFVYGEFIEERGQGSLLAILLEINSDEEKQEVISYFSTDELYDNFPVNINMPTRQLLVTTTVSIDHLNAKIIG